ncbi:MAG TPA: adenylyl-sulfate kinase [Bryobacteraceae bacterium]|nr:adenylyl-sulfate kinase [Bryobacteraceae bacterium]
MERKTKPAFALWITGLPAAGKSTLATAIKELLNARGMDVAVLESDALRQALSEHPGYSEEERERFYKSMVYIGALLVEHGVPVIFDATANRRIYRDRARQQIARFLEVYVESPLETCMARDPKGIYRQAREGALSTVPGLQSAYEPPAVPALVVHGDSETSAAAAQRIVRMLEEKSYLAS